MDGTGSETLDRVELAKRRIVNRRVNPLLLDLPDKFVDFEPGQREAIGRVVNHFDDGAKFVFLDAPTGCGKTVIGETARRELDVRAVYMCTTKSLQEQFLADFPYARVLKGRGNYPTERFPTRYNPGEWQDHLSCEDCTWEKKTGVCKWCSSKSKCPYELAKSQALGAKVAVLNTSYFLAEANNVGRFADWDLVIVDEADTLERALMGYVSVEISERRMERYGLAPPRLVTVAKSWAEWLDETIPIVQKQYDWLPEITSDVRVLREAKYLAGLIEKLQFVRRGVEDGYWVYVDSKRDKGISFQPSRVDSLGWEYFWQHGTRFLCMSATPISCQEIAESTGLTGHNEDFRVVKMASPFPVANRRVTYMPTADMARKHSDRSWDMIANKLEVVLLSHPTERVLVHTVSYDLTRFLRDHLRKVSARDIVSYDNAQGRQTALQRYLQREGAVLLGPSLDRGIDLPGEACRVQVLVKVPFPFLDRVTSARLHSRGGQQWYTIQTIRAIVQMCGRAVRNKEDWAATYVLDTQFETGVWGRGRSLFPDWFVEAVDWRSGRR